MEQKIMLKEGDIPRQWYNLAVDLPIPVLPPLGPDVKPVTHDMLAPMFLINLIEQEVSVLAFACCLLGTFASLH